MKQRGTTLGGRFGTSWAGGQTSTRWGGTTPPQSVHDATGLWAQDHAPKGGETHKGRSRSGGGGGGGGGSAPPPMYLRLIWKCDVGAQLVLKRLIWG